MVFLYLCAGLYVVGMVFILLYSLAQGHLLFHFLRAPKKGEETLCVIPNTWPHVTVQLPIYNELYVVERLIDAISQLNYPKELLEIQVLDDSTDQTAALLQRKLAEYPDLNWVYLHRSDRTGFKAGALKAGLAVAHGDFVAIFDADFVPDPDFLFQTIPFFTSPEVGMVQTRWTHLNRSYSLLTELQAFALDAHFFIEQLGRNRQGAFINFNGTGGIWRKSCILDAGNWHDDTLTEDLDLSYRAQRKGWKFVYRPEIHSPAELPPIMSAIKSQQFRWTKGGAECAVKHAGQVLSEPHPLRVKLHSLAHLLNSTVFVFIFISSLCSIGLWWATEMGMIPGAWLAASGVFMLGFVIVAGVYLVSYLSARRFTWGALFGVLWRLPLFLSVSMGLSLHNTQAVLEGLTGKKSPFVRTPKFNLEAGTISLQANAYRLRRMPLSTWLEGGMALLFLGMVCLSVAYSNFLFLPLHLLLALGYGLVFYSSLSTR